MPHQRGLTLLELLVVLVVMALITATVVLSVRDDARARLDREADRLTAQLEAARTRARAEHSALQWHPVDGGYAIGPEVYRWFDPQTSATLQVGTDESASSLPLGPEPILPVMRLQLQLGSDRLVLQTDGLRPFEVQR